VTKTQVVIGVEKRGRAFGNTRMAVIEDASKNALRGLIQSFVALGRTVRTDGWPSYLSLKDIRYVHDRVVQRNNPQTPSELQPGVHLVASLLKCWLLGTHQGAVSPAHLPYYLDEFTFHFNRRTSKSRGKWFYRLIEHAAVNHLAKQCV
jgi:ISXO2-like transposase domain